MNPGHAPAASPIDEMHRLGERVAQLEHELAAQIAGNQELRARNEDLTDLVETAGILLHRLDAEGRILWANQAELSLLGYAADEYIGRHITEFHVDGDGIRDILRRLKANETVAQYETRLRCRDGGIREVAVTSSVQRSAAGFLHIRSVATDITDRKRSEHRLALQFAVSQLLTTGEDPGAVVPRILRAVSEHLGFAVACWWERLEGESVLRCAHLWRQPDPAFEEFERESRSRSFPRGAGLPGRVWAQPEAAWITTIQDDDNFPRASAARTAGLPTGVAVPVMIGSGCAAVMEFFSRERRPPDEQLLEALTSTGREVGQYVARRQAERAVEARVAHLQVLYEMAAALNSAGSIEHIYAQSLTTLERLFGIDRASILLFDEAGVMRFRFWKGISEEYRSAVDGHSPWSPGETSATPILVPDVARSAELVDYQPVFEKEGIAALAFIPLISRERLIGKFMLYYRAPHQFSDAEVNLTRTIANHVAVAIERKEAEATLEANQARLSLALQAADTGVWEWNIATNRVIWSDRVYEIHGLPPGSLSGAPVELQQLFHPDDRERVADVVLAAVRSRGSYQIEIRIVRPGGEVRWIATSGRVVCGDRNQPVSLIGTTVDITDRKNAEDALRESSETIRALLESASQAILSVDESGRIVMANAMAERMFGYTRAQLTGATLEMLVPERFRHIHARHRETFLQAPRSRPMGANIELAALRRDGSEFPVEISLSSVATNKGRLSVSFITDVSTRKQAEEELRQSDMRYRTLFEHSNDALGVSANEHFEYVNAAFARMFGYESPEDLIGRSIYETVPLEYREKIRKYRSERRVAMSLEAMLFRSAGRRKDGTEFLSEVRATDFWMSGRLYTLAILRDITAEHQAEEALARQAGELARSNADLQQFAYATSHDLQEPLRNITSFAQLLARRYKGRLDDDADEFISTIVSGCGRMEALIHDLLAFSRVTNSESPPMVAVDMSATVRWALNNLETSVRETGAEITFHDLPVVRGDQVQLVQLLQNLLSNAIKYRSEKPRISISARQIEGEWLFSVEDNGIGIAPEYHERVFGLFKRLHGRAIPGTGVGLAICRKIVEKHGGQIWLESVPGSGSVFFFTLPL